MNKNLIENPGDYDIWIMAHEAVYRQLVEYSVIRIRKSHKNLCHSFPYPTGFLFSVMKNVIFFCTAMVYIFEHEIFSQIWGKKSNRLKNNLKFEFEA